MMVEVSLFQLLLSREKYTQYNLFQQTKINYLHRKKMKTYTWAFIVIRINLLNIATL